MLTPVRVLFVVLLGLGVGLASLWMDERGQPLQLVWQAPGAIEPSVPQVNALPTPSLTPPEQLLSRPLFVPDRKPPPPPPPPKAELPPDPMASVRLFGVIGGETAGIIAQVDGVVKRVMLRQKIGSWSLSAIEGRKVTFEREGESRDLMLAYNPLGLAPSLPTAPPVARATGSSSTPPAGGFDPASVASRTQEALRERQRLRAETRARAGLHVTP